MSTRKTYNTWKTACCGRCNHSHENMPGKLDKYYREYVTCGTVGDASTGIHNRCYVIDKVNDEYHALWVKEEKAYGNWKVMEEKERIRLLTLASTGGGLLLGNVKLDEDLNGQS